MLTDNLLYFSKAQAVTTSAASTDTVDFSVYRDIGNGAQGIELFVTVDEAVTAAGAATVTFSLEDSADNSSWATLVASAAIGKASLTLGANTVLLGLALKVPLNARRYLRTQYTIGTGPLTAGKFTAGLVWANQSARAYPNLVL